MYKFLVALALCASTTAAFADSFAYSTLDSSGTVETGTEGDSKKGALYEVGSIAKFACTVAALRLVDRGSFALDDSIERLLPQFANTSIASISIRNVLASRSGIADGLMPAFRSDPVAVMSTPDAASAVTKYALGDLTAAPGSAWSYDLVNWIVIQAVIEARAKKGIGAVLEELVLRPSGMNQSRIFVGEIGPQAQPPTSSSPPLPQFLTCAGGIASTPSDLIALVRFPHKGGLSAKSLKALTTITTPEEGYTLGGRYRSDVSAQMLSWQSGSNGAYKSLASYDPEEDTGFAAMTACGSSEAISAARESWMEARTRPEELRSP